MWKRYLLRENARTRKRSSQLSSFIYSIKENKEVPLISSYTLTLFKEEHNLP
jgi:hypothetical protein